MIFFYFVSGKNLSGGGKGKILIIINLAKILYARKLTV